jgi:hypothetical protein
MKARLSCRDDLRRARGRLERKARGPIAPRFGKRGLPDEHRPGRRQSFGCVSPDFAAHSRHCVAFSTSASVPTSSSMCFFSAISGGVSAMTSPAARTITFFS